MLALVIVVVPCRCLQIFHIHTDLTRPSKHCIVNLSASTLLVNKEQVVDGLKRPRTWWRTPIYMSRFTGTQIHHGNSGYCPGSRVRLLGWQEFFFHTLKLGIYGDCWVLLELGSHEFTCYYILNNGTWTKENWASPRYHETEITLQQNSQKITERAVLYRMQEWQSIERLKYVK